MKYWRQQDATPGDLEAQDRIARYIRDVGLDIARDCGEKREEEPESEFRRRAHEANIHLFAYLQQVGGLSFYRTSCQPPPRRDGLIAMLWGLLGVR